MRKPTTEECAANAPIEVEHGTAFAAWYPQMGGYSGRCVVVLLGGCFDCYVWHDGEFPFDEGEPRQLHHCEPDQFVEFGKLVRAKLDAESEPQGGTILDVFPKE